MPLCQMISGRCAGLGRERKERILDASTVASNKYPSLFSALAETFALYD